MRLAADQRSALARRNNGRAVARNAGDGGPRGLDLFDMILRGDAAGALNELGNQYSDGPTRMAVLRDCRDHPLGYPSSRSPRCRRRSPTVFPEERTPRRDHAETLPNARPDPCVADAAEALTNSPAPRMQ